MGTVSCNLYSPVQFGDPQLRGQENTQCFRGSVLAFPPTAVVLAVEVWTGFESYLRRLGVFAVYKWRPFVNLNLVYF